MKIKETKRKNLKIGKEYFFDSSLNASGVFVERTDKELKFKPNGKVGYTVEEGTVNFINDNDMTGFYLKS